MGTTVAKIDRREITAPQLPPSLEPLIDPAKASRRDYDGSPSREWILVDVCPCFAKDQIPTVIERFKAAALPPPPEFTAAHLAKLAIYYRVNLTVEEKGIVAEVMLEDLSHIPADILLECIRQHRCRSPFFPKSCEILELAEPMIDRRRFLIHRMEQLMQLPTPDEMAERKRQGDHRVPSRRA